MGKKIDLRSPKVREQKRQVATYGTQTPLSSTAVERGSTRWLNGSTVVIEGLLDVTGTATVGGTLSVTGTFNGSGVNNLDGTNNLSGDNNLTGPTEISGSLDVTGPTTIDGVLTINGDTSITGLLNITGDTTITGLLSIEGDSTISGKLDVTGAMSTKGTLSVEGVTTLKNDLNVTEGGKITAGDLMIEPAAGGQVNFLNGSLADGSFGAVLTNTIGAEIFAPKIDLSATNTNVSGNLNVKGVLEVTNNTRLLAQLDVTGTTWLRGSVVNLTGIPSTPNPPNLHITSGGQVYRSTWTP
ncbi:hypothetical protein [Glutamicibacter sp.]|uniref:hypothetical protein n=1 Tax=Glutamicibacter sp. TaxID=1931995 RepID=UPI002FDF7F57